MSCSACSLILALPAFSVWQELACPVGGLCGWEHRVLESGWQGVKTRFLHASGGRGAGSVFAPRLT